ncbi:hypothetical protein [Chryseobacterium indologenes]|uniref:hypothetical protein n=1 Tax=Chryseobacterium indologenes TaxID=253 RepID=UPI003D3353C7
MSKLEFKRTEVAGDKTIYAHVLETALGGFALDVTGLTKGDQIPAGTAFTYDEATRLAKPDQTAPKGLLYEDVVIDDNTSVDIVLRGTVYARRIPALTDALKAKMPQIIFSQSK